MPTCRTAPARSKPYLADIDATPLITAEDERELAGQVACGDAEARDRLVRANLRLVVTIARGYLGRGLPLEDLIAESNLGLNRASEGFDASVGTRFSTYASYWIKQSIRRAVLNQGKPVRLPAYAVTLVAKWKRASAYLEERLGRMPSPDEVGELLKLPKKRIRVAMEALRAGECFGTKEAAGEEENGPDAYSAPGRHGSLLDALAAEDDFACVSEGLGGLDERQATVIRMRFGLAAGTPATLREIGEVLGLTRERVRQLEKRALASLMEYVGAKPEAARN
jgi:RNA polymerase primary sigma factor